MKMFKWGVEGGKPDGQQARHAARVVLQGQRPQRRRLRPRARRRRTSPRITAKSRSSSAATSSTTTAARTGSASPSATSSPTTSPSAATIYCSRTRSCASAASGPMLQHRRAAGAPGRHEPHPPRRRRCCGRSPSSPARRTCATRSPTSSTTTSSTQQHRVPGDVHLHFFGTATRELRRRHPGAGRRRIRDRPAGARARRWSIRWPIEPGGLALHDTRDAVKRSQGESMKFDDDCARRSLPRRCSRLLAAARAKTTRRAHRARLQPDRRRERMAHGEHRIHQVGRGRPWTSTCASPTRSRSRKTRSRRCARFIAQKVDVIAFSPVVETGWETVLQRSQGREHSR